MACSWSSEDRSDLDFKRLFESLPGLYLVLDGDLTILAVSGGYLAATLKRQEDLLGRSLFEVFPDELQCAGADEASSLRASLQRVLALRRPDAVAARRYDLPRPLGGGLEDCHWRLASSTVLADDGSVRFLILSIEDLADVVRLQEAHRASEERLRQAQKMEAVGRLASGIAHDFNNLLTVILSGAERLEQQLGLDRNLEAIQHAAERAARLTGQLLAFGRKQILAPRILSLDAVVKGLRPILARLLGEDIELVIHATEELRKVFADQGQLEQVILNLVVNARDAMPEGGKLTLETANVDLDLRYARDHPGMNPGPHVMLAVTDTGFGMDPETQARAFDPFFTTKAAGKGTGLGLATVFGIVKQSGGHIWLYSEVGIGTTFKLYFPETPMGGGAPSAISDPVPAGAGGGDETVLLVEDEAQVREMTAAILRGAGYTVLLADSGDEALGICTQHRGRINLLLTDVIMPGMNGRRTADVATAIRPGLAVLFMSGYPDEAILRHGVIEANIPFLQKPFTPSQLRMKVREALGFGQRHA